jgi:hypothetical protein
MKHQFGEETREVFVSLSAAAKRAREASLVLLCVKWLCLIVLVV